jgi:MFS family permease
MTWLSFTFAVVSASLYGYILALAANWAGHKRMMVVRWLILAWAWLHVVIMGCGVVGMLHVSFSGNLPEIQGWRPCHFAVALALTMAAWIWILLARVETRSNSDL